MKASELKLIIRKHAAWLNGREGGERANLSCAKDGAICRMDFGGWSICIRSDATKIGCQLHKNDEWLGFSSADVASFASGASEWWAIHGEAVKAAIRCVMAKAAKEKE